jgi:ribonucleoside-triphosphate reductase
MEYVIKRDGTKVPFDKSKIVNAIEKAMNDSSDPVDHKLSDSIASEIAAIDSTMDVEAIQNAVENRLMQSGYYETTRSYMNYRYLHGIARSNYKELMDAVEEKLLGKKIDNQNANVDEASFGGRIGEMSRVVSKRYALDYCMSKMARENHENNEIYIHDLDSYAVGMHNCLSIPFDDLLANGFNTRQTDVRPAQSISTAFQLVAVIFQIQSLQQFGGVSATHLDWTMVPYVRKSFRKHYRDGRKYIYADGPIIKGLDDEVTLAEDDFSITNPIFEGYYPKAYQYAMDMTKRELNQAVEGMYHNLNTLQSRSGNQLPFTSINYGTCTLPEGRMVIEALLNASIKGIGKLHRTSIFPCGIFQMAKGINRAPGDPNYDMYQLALRSTAQRLYPNYANVDWSGNEGYDKNNVKTYFSTMGCRTANGWDVNGFEQLKDGRGNICPVTIILPTLAMEAKEYTIKNATGEDLEGQTVAKFMSILDQKLHEAKDMLIERFEWICSQSPESAKFMWENGTMAGYDGKDIRSALKHGTLAVGLLGMAETLQILIGEDQTCDNGLELAKKICQLYKDRCDEFKHKYSLNFGVYFTPAENLCFTAMQRFKAKYGDIKNVSDKEFFTNSVHVPVWREVTPFEKIDIESQLDGYSSAGCIAYVELDSTVKNNLGALETIVNYAMDHDIPYFAVNVPNDTCMECGYCDEIGDTCPECGSHNIRRLRRVTGYLTGDYTTAFNLGKQQEVELRVKHNRVIH